MTEVQFAKQFLAVLDGKNTKYQSGHVFDPKTFQLRIPYTLPKLSHPPHPLPPKSVPTTAPPPGSQPVSSQPSDQQPPTINITLKSTRNPTFTLHLPSLPTTTPIATLKSQVQSLLSGSVPTDKIKILHNKKPIPASKSTIHDVLTPSSSSSATSDTASTETEFGIMIMGGAPDPTPPTQTINLNNDTEMAAAGPGSENAAVEAALGVNPGDKGPVAGAAEVKSAPVAFDAVDEKLSQQQGSGPVQPGEQSGREMLATTAFWDDLQGFLEQRLKDAEEARRLRDVFEKSVVGA